MDTFTAAERAAIMRRVRGKDTGPEMAVRRHDPPAWASATACIARICRASPDLVFPCRGKALFVHGCFWHGHGCRAGRNRPSSNRAYWIPKLDRNKARDAANRRRLRALGWDVLTVWECQLKETERLRRRIGKFLDTGAGGRGLARHSIPGATVGELKPIPRRARNSRNWLR